MTTACGSTSGGPTILPRRRTCSSMIVRVSWKVRYMQRAIVTGAEGFLGRHLVRELRQHGVHVTALGRLPGNRDSYAAMGDAPWRSSSPRQDHRERRAGRDLPSRRWAWSGSAAELEQLNVRRGEVADAVGLGTSQLALLVFCGAPPNTARPLLMACRRARYRMHADRVHTEPASSRKPRPR